MNGRLKRWLVTIRRRVPPGVRTLFGLALIGGGVFGFLPVLGFWMIPFGLLVIGMDVKPVLRWFRKRRNRAR